MTEPEVVLTRNVHPNETSAYEFARDTQEILECRGYDVKIETAENPSLASCLVKSERPGIADSDSTPELYNVYDGIFWGDGWKSTVKESYDDETAFFDFHNYPINNNPVRHRDDKMGFEPDDSIMFDPEDWKRARVRDVNKRSESDPFSCIEFLPEEDPPTREWIIEVPAAYQEEPHTEVMETLRNDDPEKNLYNLWGYLAPVDKERSADYGLLDEEVPQLIADRIDELLESQDLT